MKAIRIIGLLVLIALAFAGGYVYKAVKGGAASSSTGGRKVLYWVDPMHPAYKSDKPGIAPDCGMKLEPVYADGGAAVAPAGANRKVLYYRDPKDPNYKAQKPGLNPETGSELEPVYADDISTMEVGTVQITPEKQQLIGVKYEQVQVGGGSRTIRAVGKVAIDETRIGQHRAKPLAIRGDCLQPVQQSAEDTFFFVVIAVADPHPPSVTPDLGREKQKPQARRRQRNVLERFYLGIFLAIEQHQPAIQVVGQHH
jgi:hypothetical protein